MRPVIQYWVRVCWWRPSDWSFACLIAPEREREREREREGGVIDELFVVM